MEKSFDFVTLQERQKLENQLKKQGYIQIYSVHARLKPGQYAISEHGSEQNFEGPKRFALRYLEK